MNKKCPKTGQRRPGFTTFGKRLKLGVVDKSLNQGSQKIAGIGLLLWGLFVLGTLFPDVFWVFHYPGLLSTPTNFIVLALGLLFILGTFKPDSFEWFHKKSSTKHDFWIAGGLAAFMGVLFYSFPIFSDIYGDAIWVEETNTAPVIKMAPLHWEDLLGFDYTNLKLGTRTAFGLASLTSLLTGRDLPSSFVLLDLVFGVLYVFTYVRLVQRNLNNQSLRWIMILAGLFAPFTLHFYGHYEVYALHYLYLAIFFYIVLEQFRNPNKRRLVYLGFLLVLGPKIHILSILLVPCYGWMWMHYLAQKAERFEKLLKGKQFVQTQLIPLAVIGILFYVFGAKSTFGPRDFTEETLNQVFFLPVVSADPSPLDRYNLFSWAHIFDYLTFIIGWSVTVIALLTTAFWAFRKHLRLNHPEVVIIGGTVVVYILFFFAFNPLMGMTSDWDLMSLPVIALLTLTIVIVRQLENTNFPRLVTPLALATVLLSVPTFVVNASQDLLSEHLISIGSRDFKTVYKGTSTTISHGIRLEEDAQQQVKLYDQVLKELTPYAVPGKDIETAELLVQLGELHLNHFKRPQDALVVFEDAYYICPYLRRGAYYTVATNFMVGNYQRAAQLTDQMVQFQYPNPGKALRVAIHVAVEAEQYQKALGYCQQYLAGDPANQFIRSVHDQLASGQNLDQVKYKFRQE